MLMVALALASPGAAAPAAAAACPEASQCAAGLSAAQVFDIAARLAEAGRYGEAEALLVALGQDRDIEIRTEARFRLARLREHRGDIAGAVETLRILLDEKPDAPRPRLELARLLAAQGDEGGARRELRRAGAAGLPEDVARLVDQFALALRSQRPVGGSIEVALAPDSNINRATRARTLDTVVAPLDLDEDARARSGVGLALAGQAFARGAGALARLSGRADLYRRTRFNDVVASLAAGPELRGGRARWRPAAVLSRRWFGGDVYSTSWGGSLNWLRPLDGQSQIEAEATVLDSDYRLNDAQDGAIADASFAYDRAFSTTLSGRVALRATRAEARDPAYATTSGSLELIAAKTLAGQTVIGQLSLGRLRADGRFALFPRVRRENRADLTLGLLLGRWRFQGLAPLVRLTQSWNRSTVDLYDFTRTRVEFGLSREF